MSKTLGEVKAFYTNGFFAIDGLPFEKKQHQNQQNGLNIYVRLLNLETSNWNVLKLYKNTKGYYAKVSGHSPIYLQDFTKMVEVVFYEHQVQNLVVKPDYLILEADKLDV